MLGGLSKEKKEQQEEQGVKKPAWMFWLREKVPDLEKGHGSEQLGKNEGEVACAKDSVSGRRIPIEDLEAQNGRASE